MKKLLSWSCVLLSCLTVSCGVSGKSVDEGFEAMKGKPISLAYKTLGTPRKKASYKGNGVYLWNKGYDFVSRETDTSYSNGTAYSYDYSVSVDYTVTTTHSYNVPRRAVCRVMMQTKNGYISDYDWVANGYGIQMLSGVSDYGKKVKEDQKAYEKAKRNRGE